MALPKYFYELTFSSSPHTHGSHTTKTLMRDVVIALCPAMVASVVYFGFRALALTVVSALSCVFFEWLYRKVMKLDDTTGDLSAVVTGVLLAFVCPVTIPYWVLVLGDAFAIIVVKQLYGGIGKNIMNPALAARAFLMAAYSTVMVKWTASGSWIDLFGPTQQALDTVSTATPLAQMHTGQLPGAELLDLFLGNVGGCLGETSVLALLIGFVYLLIRRVISPRIPLVFVGTVALVTFLFPLGGMDRIPWMLYQVCSGGLILGAVFMATDYVTSPVTKWGQVAYAMGCGLLTVLFRYFAAYPEGVSFAILLMNACVGMFDKIGIPRKFGAPAKGKKEG